MITARWGTHYGMDLPFNPLDIIDLIGLWVLFIGFGVLWYKIDRQKDIGRRILYYINFFTVFPSVLLLTFWIQGSYSTYYDHFLCLWSIDFSLHY